jgi:hypothetical protein
VAKRKEKGAARENPTNQDETEASNQLRFAIVDRVARIIEVAIRCGCLAFIVYEVASSISILAGKHTIADVGIKFLANVRVSEALAWIFGGSGVVYGMRQRDLRRKDTQQIGARLRKYEEQKDSLRSSSKLESQGDYRED